MPRKRREPGLGSQVLGRKSLTGTEIQRLVFRLSEPLHDQIPWTKLYFAGGDEYHLPADRYLDFQRDARRLGYKLTTIFDLYHELPNIHYERINTPFHRYLVPDPERWRYFSPLTRRWQRAPVNNGRLCLRPGWAIVHFPEGGKREFCLVEEGKPLTESTIRGDYAIAQAYGSVVGVRAVPYLIDNNHLYILWPNYVIPKKYVEYLDQLSPESQSFDTEQGEMWLWRAADRRLIDKVLYDLRLRLRPWSLEDDWVETFALLLTRAYGKYLAKEAGLPIFCKLVSCRAWDEVEDEKLRMLLTKVGEAEKRGSAVAVDLLYYLTKQVAISLTEEDARGGKLYGILLESDGVDWRGKDTGNMYYRIGLPELGIVVSWKTKIKAINNEWRGKDCLASVISGKWRLLPVLGRLRTSGGTDIQARQISRDKRDMLKRALVGVPRVEWQLAESRVLDAFNIDFDDEHWRGHNDLMRYSVCCAQVVRRTPAEYDEPALLLQDVSGFLFVLETTELSHFIPEPQDWIMFFARLSVHDLDLGISPVFHLVVPDWLTLTRKPVAEAQAVMAAVKYLYNPTLVELKEFFADTPLSSSFEARLSELIKDDEIIQDGMLYYWRYPAATGQLMSKLLQTMDEKLMPFPYHQWCSILHPLCARASRLRQ